MYNSVQDRHESRACENTIYQKAEKEYRAHYKSAFQLSGCWKILKDHKKWCKVEYQKYLKDKYPWFKKSRTSKSTSDSAHISLNLNDEAADSRDEEIEESRQVGRDKTKRMGSTSDARLTSSAAVDPSLLDALFSKFNQCAAPMFSSRKDASYITTHNFHQCKYPSIKLDAL
ncbi:hypothetical protein Tco_1351358 [Tanacetum coccineum]